MLRLTALPASFATCSTVPHEDDVQRFMVTKSKLNSVLNDEKERLITFPTPLEAMSHLQLAKFA